MNKFVKIAGIILIVMLVVAIGVYAKMFLIGNKSYEHVVIDKVTVSSNDVVISGNLSDSASAYKDYSYTLVDTELYVTIKTVKVSNKYKSGSFQISIPVNGTKVNNIHLTDDKTTKVIYSK